MTFLVIYSKMSVYRDKICHLQLNSRQIITFRLKSYHSRTDFLYMIRYNNVSRPIHDPLRPPCDQNLGGRNTPTPRIDAYEYKTILKAMENRPCFPLL